MAIAEDSTNPLLEESLASQLEKAAKNSPQEISVPTDAGVKQAQAGEAIPTEPTTPQSKPQQPLQPQLASDKVPELKSEEKLVEQKADPEDDSNMHIAAAGVSTTLDLLNDNIAGLGAHGVHPTKIVSYNQKFLLLLVGSIILGILGFASFAFWKYLGEKSQADISHLSTITEKTSKNYDEYGQTLGLFDLQKYENLNVDEGAKEKITKIIKDLSLNYVQKRDILQSVANKIGTSILDLKGKIQQDTNALNKDGFFPEELVGILKQDNAVGSIQRSLLSLEVVKFSSAIKVFSLMDTFLSSMVSDFGYQQSEIKKILNELIERGENDIQNYLNYCYNNPYEPVQCNIIGDFDKYYQLREKSTGEKPFNTSFFKKLMEHIDKKLEYSNVPSFSITFNSFDGKSNSIAFTVEVNTLKEDEYVLLKQGIKSPHIFIVSELIQLLKQSTFIVGKAIDAKDIRVTSKPITIGGSKYMVNNSVKTFTLPIQKNTEREIFDYVDKYQSNLMPTVERENQLPTNNTPISEQANSEETNKNEIGGFLTDSETESGDNTTLENQ
ncbi:MAG: hypothetical protein HG424_002740 [candidate division SR1 bacterium]|nr:hypothetical protein [candidate division SR1 bacterium]